MKEKNKNTFKNIILIILLITVLCVVGVFLLYKNGLFIHKNINDDDVISNDIIDYVKPLVSGHVL